MTQAHSVIYTNNVDETLKFYQEHFQYMIDTNITDGFAVIPTFTDGTQLIFVDAEKSGKPATTGLYIRIFNPHPELEQDRLRTAGFEVTEVEEEQWGDQFGYVHFFTITDPAGNVLQFFKDHVDESARQTLKRDIR